MAPCPSLPPPTLLLHPSRLQPLPRPPTPLPLPLLPTPLPLPLPPTPLPLPPRALWLAGIYCPNLQEVAYSSREFPATPEAIWSLSCGSPDIRALYFPPVDGRGKEASFGDHCLRNMANGFPRLRCAAVGGPSITPVGVAQFSKCSKWPCVPVEGVQCCVLPLQ